MDVIAHAEVGVRQCRHSGSCPCNGTTYPVTVHGTANSGQEEWTIQVTDVVGLPRWLDWRELDGPDMEQLMAALQWEAEKRERRLQALPEELQKVAASMRRILEAPDADADERLAALTFALRKAAEEIDALTRETT